MSEQPSVVYVLPDKMGGMMNIIASLLACRQPDGFTHHAVLTHNHLDTDIRFAQPLVCDSQTTIEFALPIENLHTVMRRLARAIPKGPGIVVASDLLDLATLSVHDVGKAVILILHGDVVVVIVIAVQDQDDGLACVVHAQHREVEQI